MFPFFTLPHYLMLASGGRFLRDDDHGTYLGSKDIREVPEVVYGELFEQTGAFAGGIGTGQQGIRKHEAKPAPGTNDLQSEVQKQEVAISLAAAMCSGIGAEVGVLGRKVRRIGEEQINAGLRPLESKTVSLMYVPARRGNGYGH